MCLHWLRNWGSKIYPGILQHVVYSLLQAVTAGRTTVCLVAGRIYSSQNLYSGLLSCFSWALWFLRGASPSFLFLPFLNCSLQYDHDLNQKGGKNKSISTTTDLLLTEKVHGFGFLHKKLWYYGRNISFTKGEPQHDSKSSTKMWKGTGPGFIAPAI